MAEIKITGNTTEAVQVINDLKSALKGVDDTSKNIGVDAPKELKKVEEELKKTTTIAEETKQMFVGIGQTLKNMVVNTRSFTELNSAFQITKGVVGEVMSTLNAFKDVLTSNETKATMKSALAGLSQEGENLNNTLSKTIDITRGVASGGSILQETNLLMTKGFNLTEKSMEKLIDVSGIYSSVTGQEMSAVMEKLAMGSQRERDATFEKMGVIIKVEEELQKYAEKMGTTVDMLSESEKSTHLLNVAVDGLKEKFNETGISASSLESPITTLFNNISANVGKTKFKIVESLSAIVGETLNYYRIMKDNNQVYFQEELNAELGKTLKKQKELTAEFIHQAELLQGKLTKEQIEHYKKLYKLDSDREKMNTAFDKDKLSRVQKTAQAEFDTLVKVYMEEQQITDKNFALKQLRAKGEEERIYKEIARAELSSEEFNRIGALKLQKETKMLDENGKSYLKIEKLKFSDSLKQLTNFNGAKMETFLSGFNEYNLLNEERLLKETEQENAIKKDADEKEIKRLEDLNTLSRKVRQNALTTNLKDDKVGLDLISKQRIESVTTMYSHLKDITQKNTESFVKSIEDATKGVSTFSSLLGVTSEDKELANAKLKWEDEIQHDMTMQRLEAETKSAEMEMKIERDKFEKKISIAKSYTKESAKTFFDSMTTGKVALEQEQKDNEDAYKKGYITEEEYSKKKKELKSQEKNYMKNMLLEITANAMQRAGTEIFNDGLQGLWMGGRMLLSPYPTWKSQGLSMVGYSLAEMGAGLTLGYAGAKIMPKTAVTGSYNSKDTTAKDTNTINQNMKTTQKVSTYLFPSERKYLQSLQESQGKLF